ncbi:MAG: hypothetical protein ABIJ39_13065 [Chloroflexota bacterium]
MLVIISTRLGAKTFVACTGITAPDLVTDQFGGSFAAICANPTVDLGPGGLAPEDVARTTIITLGAANSAQISNPVMKAFVRLFHAAYLRQYFKLCPGGEAEYQRWLPIVAAARLSEEIPEVERWLIAEAQKLEHGS